MFFKQVKGRGSNFSYIVADENTKEAAIVDPDFNSDILKTILTEENLKLLFIINTHDHVDHVVGNDELKMQFGSKTLAHRSSNISTDVKVEEGDVIQVGNISIRVLHTPGHSEDSICLLVNGKKLLTGDTMMVGSVGPTGFSGADLKGLYESLFTKVLVLGDDVEVFPGHYRGGKSSSTLGEEKRTNRALKARSFEEFSELMKRQSAVLDRAGSEQQT
jgi:glyoxylase-like metal-dependent hydrolase (beta-lactamase superfamily II)